MVGAESKVGTDEGATFFADVGVIGCEEELVLAMSAVGSDVRGL